MKAAFAELLASKKFLTAIVGTIVALGAKFGLQLDDSLVASFVALFASAIVGQGLQDHGSTAAQIKADGPPPAPAVTNTVAVDTKQAGFARLGVMIAIAAIGGALLFGCGASSQEKALMATTATLNAAEVTFVAWDGKHQLDLVAACDPTAGKTACDLTLNAYRKERDKTVAAITASYKAVDAAWTAVNDKTVATAIAAAVAVQQALAALGVK